MHASAFFDSSFGVCSIAQETKRPLRDKKSVLSQALNEEEEADEVSKTRQTVA
jgi:hypothetical protein